MIELKRIAVEAHMDARAGNWRQVIRGRKQTNLETYARRKQQAGAGRAVSRLGLRLDRFLLSIDEEGEDAIALQELLQHTP